MKTNLFFLFLAMAMFFAGCNYDHEITDLEDRLDRLEGSSLTTIDQQVTAINASIADLEKVDAQLDGYIKSLQTTAADLQRRLDETDAKIEQMGSGSGGEIDAVEQNLLNQLNKLETDIKGQLATINNTIAALQEKDAELDQKIADLRTYVDNELANYATKDWANATFATLTQYLEIQNAIADIESGIKNINKALKDLETRINEKIATDIKAAIDALRTELGDAYKAAIETAVDEVTNTYKTAIETAKEEIEEAYTVAIEAEINALEIKMQGWVNEQLQQPLKDIADLQAALNALTNEVATDEELAAAVAAQEKALKEAVDNLTAAYKKAIEDAVADGGVINAAIAEAVKTAQDALQEKIDAITDRIDNIEKRLEDLVIRFANRIQSLIYIPAHTDRKAMMTNFIASGRKEAELSFFVTPKSAVANIKQEHLFAKGVYTASTRSVDLVDLPVTAFSADAEQGTITVTLSGEHLSDAFYARTADASVFLMISDGNSECVSVPVELVPVSYLGNITDPAQAVKGDVALSDGSFVSNAKIAEMTEEQKANVAGIVFWTTADMNTDPDAKTPAKLTDDAIMAADFPNCTHGLIVALKDVSTGTAWQFECTKISDWQSNTFEDEKKDDYKSIASGNILLSNPYPINYILGYQNTKLLKAYNASLESGSVNTVLPVSLLAEWSTTNPAPANTTGWFIPSEKELTLLCGIDVENVYNDGFGSTTKELINGILENLDGDHATSIGNNYYWSSTESSFGTNVAFELNFGKASVSYGNKDIEDHYVRAVCAF